MRKLALAALAPVMLVPAALAVAQTTSPTRLSGGATVSPDKAGTKRHPRGVTLRVRVHWSTPAGSQRPVVERGTVLFPKGSLYNGGKYPKCSQGRLSRDGLRGCPKGSIMGTGSGNAYADTVLTHPKITVVNGGANRVFLYTVLRNPAVVQAPVPGVITRQRGKWAYKLVLTVPQSLQFVAGIPIALTDLSITAGHKDWLATTSCPKSHRWPFSITTDYTDGGSSSVSSSVRCA